VNLTEKYETTRFFYVFVCGCVCARTRARVCVDFTRLLCLWEATLPITRRRRRFSARALCSYFIFSFLRERISKTNRLKRAGPIRRRTEFRSCKNDTLRLFVNSIPPPTTHNVTRTIVCARACTFTRRGTHGA